MRHEPPGLQIVRLGRIARSLAMSFEEFWGTVVFPPGRARTWRNTDATEFVVRWPGDTLQRRTERQAIQATREGWRRAYTKAPETRQEQAVRLLGVVKPWERPTPLRDRVLAEVERQPGGAGEIATRLRANRESVRSVLIECAARGDVARLPGKRQQTVYGAPERIPVP